MCPFYNLFKHWVAHRSHPLAGLPIINIMLQDFDAWVMHTEERGSPSLVGRGIANPMFERTRGFESHSPRYTRGLIRFLRCKSLISLVSCHTQLHKKKHHLD